MIKRELPFASRENAEEIVQDFIFDLEDNYDKYGTLDIEHREELYDKYEEIIPVPLMNLLLQKSTREENYVNIIKTIERARRAIETDTVEEEGEKFCQDIQKQYNLR